MEQPPNATPNEEQTLQATPLKQGGRWRKVIGVVASIGILVGSVGTAWWFRALPIPML